MDDRGDVWWHLISRITDMHPGTSTDTQMQSRGRSGWGGGGACSHYSEPQWGTHTHPNARYSSAPLFPEPSYPEVIPGAVARNFPLRICFAHFMTIIFLPISRKISFMINGCSGVCEQKDIFFSLRPWVGVNEAFYMLLCRGLRYMFDMSRFVRD